MSIEIDELRKGYFGIPLARSDDKPTVFYGPFDTHKEAWDADDGGANFWMVVHMEYTIKHVNGIAGPDKMEPDDE